MKLILDLDLDRAAGIAGSGGGSPSRTYSEVARVEPRRVIFNKSRDSSGRSNRLLAVGAVDRGIAATLASAITDVVVGIHRETEPNDAEE